MDMFRKIAIIEPILMTATLEKRLHDFAASVDIHGTLPRDNAEIIRRIGDADCVLVSYTTIIDRSVIAACPQLRYIGMCCSLYTPESANVDIIAAGEKGIVVKGIRDYGDEGVAEYVVAELVRLLHGFGEHMWHAYPEELTGQRVGILGMGTTGELLARTLRFFGAEVSYYSRTRKQSLEHDYGYTYLPLDELVSATDILLTCLHKNVLLLHERELALFGNGKIIVNTSIGPTYDIPAMEQWLKHGDNYLLSDTPTGIDPSGRLASLPHVLCVQKPAGLTTLAKERLGKKVMENIQAYFTEKKTGANR